MFHPTRLLEVQKTISEDLERIKIYDSVKLYLCWYDQFLVSEEEFNGHYPCSDKKVSLEEVIAIINLVFKKPCIIRHNVIVNPIPTALVLTKRGDIEEYVEICLIKNL
jgi:hypothetical protein